MKKLLKQFGIASYIIYFLVFVFIATPFFNWRYAGDHGFGSWLAFGELIGTAKAAIWPYYCVTGFASKGNGVAARNDLHYTNSKRACDEALTIVIQFGGVTTLPPKQASDVVQLLQASVTEAELVNDSFLQRVHPDFATQYHDNYIASLRTLADAIQTGDQVKQISATANYNHFSEWMAAHAKELKFP
jgi:hypothetical protein